ncbi:uncharacterized protein LOC115634665 [Scaptodrosophila lebanonensis]|uniref:Uncharacterized protein LOC115634665 n=1 Tax=Drosophila lebanonensis TaxID=7225 RepID=A0A6J2UJH9_DROLE|nr:uncharacterized protein LOC115634665 [Scaptodrosophila lebanonensis]
MGSRNNLETFLQNINKKYININENRAEYIEHFNKLRDTLFLYLKEDPVLNKLFNGFQLGGSYGDNLKVGKPDEFDLVFYLRIPESDSIIVKRDPKVAGNVILDLTQVLNRISNQSNLQEIHNKLKSFVNANNLLLEDKLQSWLSGLVARALNKMENKIEVNGHTSELKYKKCGPAHTLFITTPNKYSVDFVPAIKLNARQNVLAPGLKQYFKVINWEAIPKPMKPFQPNNISFRASYYDAEAALLKDKSNLKSALRIMKKFRDTRQNISHLKSYYIKTLFLWQASRKDQSYWRKALTDVVVDMFQELEESFSAKGQLLFFWDHQLNMLGHLNGSQKNEMFNCLSKASYTIKRAASNMTVDIELRLLFTLSHEGERGAHGRLANASQETNSTVEPPPSGRPQEPQANEQKSRCCIT